MSRCEQFSKPARSFRKMKSRAPFSSYRVSGSDFAKTFKSRRLGESPILPFATPETVSLSSSSKL